MVYLLKFVVRLALRIFCPQIMIHEKWLLNPISPTLEEMIYKKELLFMEDRKKNYYDSEDDESD